MTPLQIFEASNGEATTALYRRLEKLGPVGVVALNLFRACKCSGRAKVYTRKFKGKAYDRKAWSMENLCQELERSGDALGIQWGWKEDPKQAFHKWVLYVDIPTGQVSFHSERRMSARDYPGEWDQTTHSPQRIVQWVTQLLSAPKRDTTGMAILATAFTPHEPLPLPPVQHDLWPAE